jgi:N-acetylmuramoyl-L-alanine amidase
LSFARKIFLCAIFSILAFCYSPGFSFAEDSINDTIQPIEAKGAVSSPTLISSEVESEAVSGEVGESSGRDGYDAEKESTPAHQSDDSKATSAETRQEEDSATKGNTEISSPAASISMARAFTVTDRYFEVAEENLKVYDNSTGKLVPVGSLVKGQVYPRVSDYGNWHQIKFGDGFGYVLKSSTIPVDKHSLKNLNAGIQNTKSYFMTNEPLSVYDNTSGSLVLFANLVEKLRYPIIAVDGNWYKVDVSGRIGYVYLGATTRPFETKDQFFKVIEDNIKIYDNRSGSLVPVINLVKGQVYKRVADEGNWHKVKYGNIFGYVYKGSTIPADSSEIQNLNQGIANSKNLTIVSAEILPVYDNSTGILVHFADLLENKSYPIIGEMGNWYRVDVSGRIGYIYKFAIVKTFTSADRYFQVKEDLLPYYDNRGGTLKPIGYLKKDEVYKRIADYGNWHQIKVGDVFGFVLKSSTKPAPESAFKNANPGSTTAKLHYKALEEIPVFVEANETSASIGAIYKDAVIHAIGEVNQWIKLDFSGRIGYVQKEKFEAVSSIYGKVIVLDPGHGGKDPGALGKYYQEKTLTLATAFELKALLEQAGAIVIMTRESDVYRSLEERAAVSNNNNPDAFISIHFNAINKPSIHGLESYYYSVGKDSLLAQEVHKSLLNHIGLTDRGVRYGNFHVIRENRYKAILLELGYISNAAEELIIATKEYQQKAARGIFEGLLNYF